MRAYEKDEEIKIPKWYMKLPLKVLENIYEIMIRLVKVFPSKKRKKTTGKIQFYI